MNKNIMNEKSKLMENLGKPCLYQFVMFVIVNKNIEQLQLIKIKDIVFKNSCF